MSFQTEKNPHNLRVIKTARTFNAINEAAKAGLRPLMKPVIPGEQITDMFAVFQDPATGQIELSSDVRYPPLGDCVIRYRTYYPYHFPAPYAAYLIPHDLVRGEKVWLEDIIEDIVSVWGNQGYHPRLEHCEATWTGTEFKIHFDPKKDAHRLIG